jgi:hypothetical protein
MDEHEIFQLCARIQDSVGALRLETLEPYIHFAVPLFLRTRQARERKKKLAHSVLTEYIWIHFNMLKPSSALNSPGGWMCSAFRLEFIRLIACVCTTRPLFSLPARLGCVFVVSRSLGAWARNFRPFAPTHTPTAFLYVHSLSKMDRAFIGEQFIAAIN